MATLKSMHKYQLKLLALNSTIDSTLKELFSRFVTKVSLQPPQNLDKETSQNVNRALSDLLKSSANSLKEMHFVTTYPAIQDVVFVDVSSMEIRDEVRIGRLDTLAICDMLTHLPELKAELENENLSKYIDCIQNFRILVATESNEVFWERFDSTEGVKLSFNVEAQTWCSIWKENKQYLMKILKFLKENDVLKEMDYNKRLEELHLFTNWSKQEILQNWYRQLNQQWRSLAFLHRIEKKLITKTEVDIHIRLSDQQLILSESSAGWLACIVEYIKSFFSAQVDQSITTIHEYELDGEIAKALFKTMKMLVESTFGSESFMEIVLLEATKGVRLFDEDEDSVIPLVVEIEDGIDSSGSIYEDPYSPASHEVWSEISLEFKKCIKQKMGILAFCIRTAWHSPRKLNMCITKANNDSWYPEECSSLINHLMNWEFLYKVSVKANPEMLESVGTLSFKLSTTNSRYYELMEMFAKIVNEKTSTVSMNVKELDETDLVEKLGLAHPIATIQKSVSQLIIKREDEETNVNLDLLGESHTSLELRSPRSDGGSSSRLSTPRILITPRTIGKSLSRESSTLGKNDDYELHTAINNNRNDKSPRKGAIQQHSSIPKRKEKKNKEETSNEVDEDGSPLRASKLTDDWLKLEIIKEFLLKPALLNVLHNDNNPITVTPSSITFPRDPKKLYESVNNLRQSHPKSFEIWRKSELNNVLLPNDGKEESCSDLWSIDMIYFVIRSSNMLPTPKNGWQQPWRSSAIDETGFWCREARALKKEIDRGRIGYVNESVLERVEDVLKGLGYKSGLLVKLREHKPIAELLK